MHRPVLAHRPKLLLRPGDHHPPPAQPSCNLTYLTRLSLPSAIPRTYQLRTTEAGFVRIYYSPANSGDVRRSRCCSRERTDSMVESYLIAKLELVSGTRFHFTFASSVHARGLTSVAWLRLYERRSRTDTAFGHRSYLLLARERRRRTA